MERVSVSSMLPSMTIAREAEEQCWNMMLILEYLDKLKNTPYSQNKHESISRDSRKKSTYTREWRNEEV